MSATRRGCFSAYASPELLAAQTVCLDQAVDHYNGAVDKSKQDRLIRNENCSKYP